MEVERAPRRPFVGCRIRLAKGALASRAWPSDAKPYCSYFGAKFVQPGAKTRLSTGTPLEAWVRDELRAFVFLALRHDTLAHTHAVEALGYAWRRPTGDDSESESDDERALVLDAAVTLLDPRQVQSVGTVDDDELELSLRAWCESNERQELALCLGLPSFALPAQKDAHTHFMLAVAKVLALRFGRPTEPHDLVLAIAPPQTPKHRLGKEEAKRAKKQRHTLALAREETVTPKRERDEVDEAGGDKKARLSVEGRSFENVDALVAHMRLERELAVLRTQQQAWAQLNKAQCEARYYRGLLEGNGWEFQKESQ